MKTNFFSFFCFHIISFYCFSRPCARVRETKSWERECLLGFWSKRIGNPTAVLLYRLFSSKDGGVVVDVKIIAD